jgi:hypothetical protein
MSSIYVKAGFLLRYEVSETGKRFEEFYKTLRLIRIAADYRRTTLDTEGKNVYIRIEFIKLYKELKHV